MDDKRRSADPMPSTIGRYQIQASVGVGAMGTPEERIKSQFSRYSSNRDFLEPGFTHNDFFCSKTWAGKTYQRSLAKM